MKGSLKDRLHGGAFRAMPLVVDGLFALWLFTEVGMEHSPVSRACMALFLVGVFLWMCIDRRAFFSYWMAAAAGLILWGLIGAYALSERTEISLLVVRTLCINLAFLFFLYQYLMLRRDMDRVFTVYIAATLVLSAYILARCWPMDLTDENAVRFGGAIGVNPNWIGMLAAVAFGLSLHKALNRSPWWGVAALLLAGTVLLTKSTKAYLMVFILSIVMVLLRWPKRWWLKLILLAVGGWFIFRFVIIRMEAFDMIFFHRARYIYENLFMGGTHENSLTVRQGLSAIGREAFLLRPFTGYGLDSFRFFPGAGGMYSHNNYIELAVSGGLPMLALFYAPQAVAIFRGAKAAKGRPWVQVTLALACVQVFMDIGAVSYVDRTLLMIPLMLMAATRLAAHPQRDGDGAALFQLAANPYKLVQWCSTRGLLKNMDDRRYLELLYRGCMGKPLHLDPPVTFNEKQQWIKLYDRDPLYHTLADKLSVRDFVKERAGEGCLIPLLGSWDRAEDVDLAALPERFVLKCTHDSGSACLCPNKADFDMEQARAFLKKHLQKDYSIAGREWPYKGLTPRVMAEAYLGNDEGEPPEDYKFYCFHGVCRAILVCKNRRKNSVNYLYFDRNFDLYPINHETVAAVCEGRSYERPPCLGEMIALSERLAAGFPFMRVDLYQSGGRVYFGEMTLFDNSGFATDLTEEGDKILGSFLHLREGARP